jgi:poly(beta-D-mannuronate) lyase
VSGLARGCGAAGLHRYGRRIAAFLTVAFLSVAAERAMGCPTFPAPISDINAFEFRTDIGGAVDPVLRERNNAVMEPLRTYARFVSSAADRFVADADIPAGMCALSGLRQWAQASALLGVMANAQAERERATLVSGLAFAYLKTKGLASDDDKKLIEAWLVDLAKSVETGFAGPARPRSVELAGLAALAVGAATGDREHWQFGESVYDQALAAIDNDGLLSTAMMGGERVLFDQNIALGALVMMAELAARQLGQNWYMRHDGAIHRFADRVLDGLHDPSWLGERCGKSQFLPSGRDLAWIAFYARRFPDRFAGRVPDGANFQSPRLGGDLTVLAEKWVRG